MLAFAALPLLVYIGGSAADDCDDVTFGRGGDVFLACHSTSNDFPGAPRAGGRSDFDAVVVRVTTAGKIVWARRIGGTGYDNAVRIAAAPDGGVVVCGFTESDDFPATEGRRGGGKDAWVARLNPAGRVLYTAVIGGSGDEIGNAIALGPDGLVHAAGRGFVASRQRGKWSVKPFPVEKIDGLIRLNDGRLMVSGFTGADSFVAVLDGWRTDLPATVIWSMTVNGSAGPVIAGARNGHAYVARLDGRTGAIVWSTELDAISAGYDGSSVAVDRQGRIWVAGEAAGRNAGDTEGFVAALPADGRRVLFRHDAGGPGRDLFESVAVGPGELVVAAGLAMRDSFDAMLLFVRGPDGLHAKAPRPQPLR
jgi:outer membrane protein assembly factor BamB